jgi:antitoxin ParD1/3/4
LQKWLELLAFRMAIFGNARASTEAADYLVAIRARIRRSLDDPRPDMTLAEVDAHLAALFARAARAGDHTSSA